MKNRWRIRPLVLHGETSVQRFSVVDQPDGNDDGAVEIEFFDSKRGYIGFIFDAGEQRQLRGFLATVERKVRP